MRALRRYYSRNEKSPFRLLNYLPCSDKSVKIFLDQVTLYKGKIVSQSYLNSVVVLILCVWKACRMKAMKKAKILISITFLQKEMY